MKEEIKCKYKFQNKEKFSGKECCTLFYELCENVSFFCDNNCPIYEDYKQLKSLEKENKWQRDEEKYLKKCCIKAGKELEKNSFEWDGKEKNLVVQALELNKRYEALKQENEELRTELNEHLYGVNDGNIHENPDLLESEGE